MAEPRHFVAESYTHDDAAAATARAARAVAALRRRGRSIRHVWSLAAPDEELCLHLFETDSAALVAEVAVEAELAFDRVWPAVPIGPPDEHERRTQ
jgi:hypothetical protein